MSCEDLARAGARERLTDEPDEGLPGADLVYTDVWVSLGEPTDVRSERVRLLRPYQVNRAAMERTGNRGARFMHCLPALHDANTTVGREIIEATGMDEGLEVPTRASRRRPAACSIRPSTACTRSRRCSWPRSGTV